MNVTCHSCSTVYRVDPLKVPATGVRARCKVCAAVFPVHRSEAAPAAPPASVPARAATLAAAPPEITAPRPAPPIPQVTQEAPIRPPEPSRVVPPPFAPPPPVAPPAAAPSPPAQPRVTVAPPPAVPGIGARPTLPRQFAPGIPSSPNAPAAAPGVARPSVPVPPAAPPARPAPPLREPSKTGSRPVNPFLTSDPSQKARRLARALISDLAVYYPDRRKEGLAKGTLKELFKEEIQKSWEEYSEQVGKEVANSTTFFTDALNEILAGGQRVF